MAEKLTSKYYKLERLLKWDKVEEVNKMLLGGVSPIKVMEFCKKNGFDISHPKLYEYKGYLLKAIQKQMTVEALLGIGKPSKKDIHMQIMGVTDVKDLVKSELDVLDAIIQRGFNALTQSPTVKIQDAMRAIELKNKITQGIHEGLTSYGLDQLRAIEQAKFQAMIEVVMKYIPEDKIPELEEAIATAEREYYEQHAPELLEEYEKAMQEELDKDPNNTIVSDVKF